MTQTVDTPTSTSTDAPPSTPNPVPPLIGAILIILLSLGSIGYGLYELVFSGIATGRAQSDLATEFEERRSDFAAEQGRTTGTIAEEAVALEEAGFDDLNDVPVMIAPAEGGPEVVPVVVPGVIEESAPGAGEALGRIQIPKIDVDWVIVEGVTAAALRDGPGHMPHTPLPGQPGNAVVSGHRTTNGAPFGDLDELVEGDTVLVETLIGTHTYEVVGSIIVKPDEMWVTSQWEGGWLTLTTCHPKFSSRERLIVFARLVSGPNHEAIHGGDDIVYEMPERPAA